MTKCRIKVENLHGDLPFKPKAQVLSMEKN